MTSISYHAGHGKKLTIVAEKVVGGSGSRWIDLKILEGTREIGEITVFDATEIEVTEPAV